MNEMENIEEIVSVHDSFMMGHLQEDDVSEKLGEIFDDLLEDLSKKEIKKTIKSLELEDEFEEIAFDILGDM